MKLTTRKYVSFITFCLVICFVLISFFGIHSRWGDTVKNHFKGWQNLRFGQDLDNHIEMTFKSSDEKVNLSDKKIAETINSRLQNLGFTDNKIFIDSKNNQLILKTTQPAGQPDFEPSTIEKIVVSKNFIAIDDSQDRINALKAAKGNKDAYKPPIGFDDIAKAEVIIKNQPRTNKPEYGLKIKFTKKGTQKLAALTSKIFDKNKELQKKKKDPKKPETPHKLSFTIDDVELNQSQNPYSSSGGIEILEPITNGVLEVFNNFSSYAAKIFAARLNEPPLPSYLYLEKLSTASPNLGMWFKRSVVFAGLITVLIVVLILVAKFKLIGLICSVCFLGHLAFILACFTGFFPIYPGVIFNSAALFGTIVSIFVGICSCFLISKTTTTKLKLSSKQFTANLKNGLTESLKTTNIWNFIMLTSSLVLMALFSYKTNTIMFLLKPLYGLVNLNLLYSNSVSSLAYALLVGSVGSILFEIVILKFIATSVTQPDLKFDYKKAFMSFQTKIKSLKKIKINGKKENKPTQTKTDNKTQNKLTDKKNKESLKQFFTKFWRRSK